MSKISNKIVFNPPTFDFSKINSFKDQIIYIPKRINSGTTQYIPCLFVIEYDCSSNFLIYFHGNSEDIFECELFGFHLSRELKMNLVFVEYCGYSIYPGTPDSEIILSDSIIVYDYLKEKFKLKPKNIFICGRSLGSAPAIYLASQREIQTLFLISAFESIKKVGRGYYAGFLFEDIFRSIDLIPKVKCPTLFIHGENDKLINCNHSKKLCDKCGAKKKLCITPKDMNHNNSDFQKDILAPIKKFLLDMKIEIDNRKNYFNIEDESIRQLYIMPDFIKNCLEGRTFDISSFINLNKIPGDAHTCILPVSKEVLIYSVNNEIKICFYDEVKLIINLNSITTYVIYLLLIEEGKFLFITNIGEIFAYSFDHHQYQYLDKISSLNKAKKAINCDNNNFLVLGEQLTKIEMTKEIILKQVMNNIYNKNLYQFNDILQINKDEIILSSDEFEWLAKLSLENFLIKGIKERIKVINEQCLYKLNEESFAVIEKTGIIIVDSATFLSIYNIPNKDIYFNLNESDYQMTHLYIIDEEDILIGDNKGNITQYNLTRSKKGNVLNFNNLSSNYYIISFSLIDKQLLIAFIKNEGYFNGESYCIDIRKSGRKKNQDGCHIF